MAVAVLSAGANRNAIVCTPEPRTLTELEAGSSSDSLEYGGATNVILESCWRCFSTLCERLWDSGITTAAFSS